jgi:carbonic anhydrase
VTRFLVIAALLAAGCEQLKTPKKLKELEGRVDELSAQVDRMATRSGASRLKASKPEGATEGHDGSGEAAAAPKEAGEGKDGEAKPETKPEGSEAKPEGSEAKPDDKPEASAVKPEGKDAKPDGKSEDKPDGKAEDKPEAKPEARSSDKPEEQAARAGEPGDAGVDAAMSKDDRALSDIARLVASTTGKKKPEADPPRETGDAKDAKGEPGADGKDGKVAKAGKLAKDAKASPGKDAKATKDPKDPKAKPATEWGYNAAIGPPVWATLDPAWRVCDQGKAQSPVDIEPRPGNASPIVFHYKPTASTIVDTGHTLEVDLEDGSWIEIADHTYQLVELHFHSPSEHTIAGEHYPLEAQLVHKDSRGRLAMISVLYDVGAESRAIGGLFAKWPRKIDAPARLPQLFDPATLLPATRTVFRYTGSLTTPPCTEGVVWNVMRRAMSDSKAHLDAFTSHYKINARETQPLHDRKIE